LRVSNTAANSSNNRPDETKRIQFHIEEKQAPPPKKVEKVESTSDEETESSASAAIDDVGSKTKLDFLESPISKESSSTSQQKQQPLGKPTLQTMKRLSINSQNSKSGSSIDSNLSEAASGSGSSNKNKSDPEVMPVERSLTKTNSVQRPPGSVPRTSRPSSARNLSSTLTKEAKIFEASTTSGSSSSSDCKDDVLQNVKFKDETLTRMQDKKNQLVKRSSLEKKEEHLEQLVGQPLSRESLKTQIESQLRNKHDEDIQKLKEEFEQERLHFEKEKEDQEKVLRDMFHAEMDAIKSRVDNDLAKQKALLLKDFDEKLHLEKQHLQKQHEKLMNEKDEEFRKEMANLREDFQNKKTELEQELRAQFQNDIAHLRQELKKVRSENNKPEPQSNIQPPQNNTVPPKPIPATRSATTNHKKSSHHHQSNPTFLKEIEGIEDDIKQLRSQVKMGSSTILAESDDTSTSMLSDDFEPGGIQFSRHGRHENHRFAPPVDMAVYPSDLNRTLETLQQRVQALEKNLAPFTTGYPAMQSSYGYQMNSTPMTNGFQYSPSPLPNANGFEPPPARVINGWTVDDQINKSKMWLKQRNQQMMSRK